MKSHPKFIEAILSDSNSVPTFSSWSKTMDMVDSISAEVGSSKQMSYDILDLILPDGVPH